MQIKYIAFLDVDNINESPRALKKIAVKAKATCRRRARKYGGCLQCTTFKLQTGYILKV
jgi:hypothetical protein